MEEENIYHKKVIEYIDIQFFKGTISKQWKESIEELFKTYGFDELTMIELFNYCFDRGALYGSYIKAVANEWGKNNIKTLKDLEDYLKSKTEENKETSNIGLMGNNTDSHMRRFDELFGTKTRKKLRSMPIFRHYFDRFKNELYSESEERKQLKKEREEIYKELEGSLSEEQKELFSKYRQMEEKINIDLERQLFLFGCIASQEMIRELNEVDIDTGNSKENAIKYYK